MLLATGWLHHRGVRAHEPRANLMEWGIYMRDGSSTTEDTKSAGPSPLRLRVGVFLILCGLCRSGRWRPASRIPSAG
jgi:hypothetical protein